MSGYGYYWWMKLERDWVTTRRNVGLGRGEREGVQMPGRVQAKC